MEYCKINNCQTRYSTEKYTNNRNSYFNSKRKRTLTSDLSRRWKKFPIPFVIEEGVNRSAVLTGIANWEQSTCLTFKEKGELPSDSSGLRFVLGSG